MQPQRDNYPNSGIVGEDEITNSQNNIIQSQDSLQLLQVGSN